MAVVQSTIDPGSTPMLPAHPDGDAWSFILLFGDHQQAVADTVGELLAIVIDGYDAAQTDAAAFVSRLDHAAKTASGLQTALLQAAIDNGFRLDDDDVTTALLSSKAAPLPLPVSDWSTDLPQLLLVATHYAPYTDTAPPTGNVVLIDPTSEKDYLHTLADLGLGTFMELNLA